MNSYERMWGEVNINIYQEWDRQKNKCYDKQDVAQWTEKDRTKLIDVSRMKELKNIYEDWLTKRDILSWIEKERELNRKLYTDCERYLDQLIKT